mmetsp:Transcript_13019/g.26585  ORF Transcript_13019/g.26585 Transcript_13019/m.26585 type:complete len:267 (-) Transcript_13019:505-1305(-)
MEHLLVAGCSDLPPAHFPSEDALDGDGGIVLPLLPLQCLLLLFALEPSPIRPYSRLNSCNGLLLLLSNHLLVDHPAPHPTLETLYYECSLHLFLLYLLLTYQFRPLLPKLRSHYRLKLDGGHLHVLQMLQFLLLLLPLHHLSRIEREAGDWLKPDPLRHFEKIVSQVRLAVHQQPSGRLGLLEFIHVVRLWPGSEASEGPLYVNCRPGLYLYSFVSLLLQSLHEDPVFKVQLSVMPCPRLLLRLFFKDRHMLGVDALRHLLKCRRL